MIHGVNEIRAGKASSGVKYHSCLARPHLKIPGGTKIGLTNITPVLYCDM